MTTETLTDDLTALRALKEQRDEAKRGYEFLDAEFKRDQARVMERMEAEGAQSVKADGTTFSPVSKEYGTIQDRSTFVAWAQDNNEELIEFKERKELLNALVREALDNGEELPPGVGFYQRSYISMRSS